MADTPATRARNRAMLPAGLVGMIALVAAIELGLARSEDRFTTLWAAAWEHSGWAASRRAPRCEILAFGDSLVKHGLVPRVVELRTGRRCYNLAAFLGMAPLSYYLLRQAIEAGARPEAVLIDGEVLDADPLDVVRLWPEALGLRDLWDLARTGRDLGFFGPVAVARLLPSARLRYEVRAEALAALGGEDLGTRQTIAIHRRNWARNLGTDLMPAEDRPPDQDPRPAAMAGLEGSSRGWRCHPLNARYTRRFLQLAKDHGIEVYWLLPPIYADFLEQRSRGGRDGSYVAFVRGLQERFPNLVVLDGRHSGYVPSTLADLTHLNRRGALGFSAAVGDEVGRRLGSAGGGPRWVALPAYREEEPGVVVEDIPQSHAALLARPDPGAVRR